jgi:hypothetical protein
MLSTKTPNSRCRHLRPWMATSLERGGQPSPRGPYPLRVFGRPNVDSRWLCPPFASPVMRLGTPSVVPRNRPGDTVLAFEDQSCFHLPCANTTCFHRSERLAPIGPAPSALCLRSRRRGSGRHWHSRCGAPRAQLPTCVHPQWLCARPKCLPGFSPGVPGPHAAHRLLQLSDPKAPRRTAQTLSLVAVASYRAFREPCLFRAIAR